ncbi:hypothetical protein KA005_63000, partial [bacterium]|nr:hypothetical protein [bacterium]
MLFGKVGSIESQLARQQSLSKINKAYKKGAKGLKKVYEEIDKECKKHVPPETKPDSILPQLLQKRDDAVGKIFKGNIVLPDYTQQEKNIRGADEIFIVNFVDEAFISKYTGLGVLSAARDVIDRINFYGLGFAIMAKEPEKCPFCEQIVDTRLEQRIRGQHQKLVDEKSDKEKLERQRREVRSATTNLRMRLQSYNQIHIGRSTILLGLESTLDTLKKILEQKYKAHCDAVVNTVSDIKGKKEKLSDCYDGAVKAIDAVVSSIDKSQE